MQLFFILFQFVQFFQFRVFLIKKSCRFLCVVLVLTVCVLCFRTDNETLNDREGKKIFSPKNALRLNVSAFSN